MEEYETALEENKTPNRDVSVDPTSGSVTVKAGEAGPVPTMMSGLLGLAKSGGLDGSLLTSRQFFQTDYTKPLLFMADGGLLAERAEAQHLLGDQWGMMNETGSYPGQAWLWLYTVWYQVEPFKTSENADILVMLVMGVLSLAFVLHSVHPRHTRHPAPNPDLPADLARALPRTRSRGLALPSCPKALHITGSSASS